MVVSRFRPSQGHGQALRGAHDERVDSATLLPAQTMIKLILAWDYYSGPTMCSYIICVINKSDSRFMERVFVVSGRRRSLKLDERCFRA